jgi:cytosine/adenosine deaminase-related metal-dependent hydrolase
MPDHPPSSQSHQPPIALRARWIVPVASPPVADGWLTVERGRIVSVGTAPPAGARRVDLGNAMILPGLINAHAHLEFSLLDKPLGEPGQPLPDWIRQVIAYRRTSHVDRAAAVAAGLAESQRHGTVLIGEIATGDWLPSWYQTEHATDAQQAADAALRLVLFHELIGFRSQTVSDRAGEAQSRLTESIEQLPANLTPGISPHAPYTVHPELLRQLVALADQHGCPLAMHLAESPEEMELLEHGTGPMQQLLQDAGVWEPDVIPRGTTPSDYLRALTSGRSRVLAVHCNYFSADDVATAAALRDRLSVVYCPRTHAYFWHARYPLAEMLAAGVRVVLGTDGRCSNPDLNVLNEVRHVAAHHPLPVQQVLQLVTRNAAEAFGLNNQLGTLEPTKMAELTVLSLPEGPEPADPLEWLLDERVQAIDWRSKMRGHIG